jgi:hypothetical protein
MSNEYEIARPTGRCAVTDRPLAEGESYYAVLLETPDGFERRDYAVDAWEGPPEGSFCYWKARVPVREKKREHLSFDPVMLTHLFLRLEDEESEMRQSFRFVLALLLMRKRLLKYEGTSESGGHELWRMRLTTDGTLHQVVNPRLTELQVDRLSAQLTAILSGEVESLESLDGIEGMDPGVEASSDAPPDGDACGRPASPSLIDDSAVEARPEDHHETARS